MLTLREFRMEGPVTDTTHPRVKVWRQDRKLYRVLYEDDLGEWAWTGAAIPTKTEALVAAREFARDNYQTTAPAP